MHAHCSHTPVYDTTSSLTLYSAQAGDPNPTKKKMDATDINRNATALNPEILILISIFVNDAHARFRM